MQLIAARDRQPPHLPNMIPHHFISTLITSDLVASHLIFLTNLEEKNVANRNKSLSVKVLLVIPDYLTWNGDFKMPDPQPLACLWIRRWIESMR